MNDIEAKALALLKTQHCPNCETTEQKLHDFRQEVSDIVKAYVRASVNYNQEAWENLNSLIIREKGQ
jgi:hypothetical protein